MKGLRSFIFSEKRLAGAIFGIVALVAFSFVFGPNIYAQFARQTGNPGWGYGYGYGYGFGSGFDGGTFAGYRTSGGSPTSYLYGYGYGYMGSDVTYNTSTGYSVTPSDMATLVSSGILVPNGGNIASTTKVTFTDKVTMTVGSGVTVTIPSGTTFTSGSAGDFSALAAGTGVSTTDLTNFANGTVTGSMSFGLPSLGLTVSPAITIAINVGSAYEGMTLHIYRKDASSTWIYAESGTDGNCTVTSGICSFTTTHLSSFAAMSPSTDTSSGGSSGSTGGSSSGGGAGGSTYTPPTTTPATDSTVTGTYDAYTAKSNNPNFNVDMSIPTATTATNCVSGTLIKSKTLSAVYYCGADGKRYVFVNDKAYFSWYMDFSGVQIVSDATLASITIGGNITYRPGTRMIKIQSDPKTYVVARGGVLRWVQTEAAATRLYGGNWNKQIDDVSDSFFVNYKVGTPIAN